MKKLILASSILISASAFAHVELRDCVIQEALPGAKVTGAFMVMNFEKHSDEVALVEAKLAELSDDVQIHEMKMSNGSMSMHQLKKFPLKKGDNVFKKGSYHLMLMDLKKAPKAGEEYKITLGFDKASSVSCQATVKSVEEIMKNNG